jgi:sterol desaturase/sphingolipid hydroxylase (fatty acid hydroxylase superfamily)
MYATIILVGLGFMALERTRPDQLLPHSNHWWGRAVFFNLLQLGVVLLGGVAWDVYLQRASLFSVGSLGWSGLSQGAFGYLISTFIYYWWHRVRHHSDVLWLTLHQIHHSPARLETITAFYKHPFELVLNSILSGLIGYTLLGLDLEGSGWLTVFSALGEFFYHMNVRTPRWVGFVIQRPEMHRIHHERGVHASNYGDLPVWDMLFGTYRNPDRYDGPCGFEDERETKLISLLTFKDVNVNREVGES